MSERMISPAEIRDVLPCKDSFLFLDRVQQIDENHYIALKAVTITELHFIGHFPNHPIMPGVLEVEAIAQLGELAVWERLDPERKYDLYVTIERIKELDAKANELIDKHDAIIAQVRDLTDQVESGEEANAAAREQVMELERQIGVAMEASMQAQGRRNQVVESIRINEQRILEYKHWQERDNSEISETRATRGIQQERIEQLAEQLEELTGSDVFVQKYQVAV